MEVGNTQQETSIQSQVREIHHDSPGSTNNEARMSSSFVYRIAMVALGLAVSVPFLQGRPSLEHDPSPTLGVKGGVIRKDFSPVLVDVEQNVKSRRADNPTDVCTRWAHQCKFQS